jgi:hypothetical protein
VATAAGGVVTGVAPGTATITATSDGQSASVEVTVRAVTREFNLMSAQFTQAAQAGDGSIPMVLGGTGAAVNVLVSTNLPGAAPMQIVLRLFNASGTLVRADTALANGALTSAPSYSAPTVQFALPPSALVPGLRWQVVRDPRGQMPDADAANDVFPRGGPAALSLVTVPVLRVRFVPIVLSAHNNTAGSVNIGNLGEYTRVLQSVFPLGAVEASIGDPFTTSTSFGTAPAGGDAVAFWTPVLNQLDAARVASSDPSVHLATSLL